MTRRHREQNALSCPDVVALMSNEDVLNEHKIKEMWWGPRVTLGRRGQGRRGREGSNVPAVPGSGHYTGQIAASICSLY